MLKLNPALNRLWRLPIELRLVALVVLIAILLSLSGCCSNQVARSARMFERDLDTYVEASQPGPGVDAETHDRAGESLKKHAGELADMAEEESW